MIIDTDQLFQCETCYHRGPLGCKVWCDAGESYRPAASKLKPIDLMVAPYKVGDKFYEVDEEHGVVEHRVTEVFFVLNTEAIDDNKESWHDQWTSEDIDKAYSMRKSAELMLEGE